MNKASNKEILQSMRDPGSITPRGDNFKEPIEGWQERALAIVLERQAMNEKAPKSLLHIGHPLANDWLGTNTAFDLLEKNLEERHGVLRCYSGFFDSHPKWQEEMDQLRRIRQRVQKLVWDEAQTKHDDPKDGSA